jgi:hypothetical protein
MFQFLFKLIFWFFLFYGVGWGERKKERKSAWGQSVGGHMLMASLDFYKDASAL